MSNRGNHDLSRRQFIRRTGATATSAAALASLASSDVSAEESPEMEKTRSYNSDMEYRRLGKTGLWVSAVCMGGHWKRVDKMLKGAAAFQGCEGDANASGADLKAFHENRASVISRCLEVGINLIDFAGSAEPGVYGKALKGRRDQMYVAWSMGGQELRHPDHRKADVLVDTLQKGLKDTGLEYADCWRLMAFERGGRHTQEEVDEMVKALEIAKNKGLCRFTGFSTHDRRWAAMLFETYPELMQFCCTPYTAKSKVLKKDSFFDVVQKQDVGVLGIKPFASNAVFKGDGSPDSPHVEEDNRTARLIIRYILMNPGMTAPIPGLASPSHVDNMALAIKERREMDLAERTDSAANEMPPKDRVALETATEKMWDNLGAGYRWLKDWEYV